MISLQSLYFNVLINECHQECCLPMMSTSCNTEVVGTSLLLPRVFGILLSQHLHTLYLFMCSSFRLSSSMLYWSLRRINTVTHSTAVWVNRLHFYYGIMGSRANEAKSIIFLKKKFEEWLCPTCFKVILPSRDEQISLEYFFSLGDFTDCFWKKKFTRKK